MFTLNLQATASLLVDSDLRAAGANTQWRRLGLPGGQTQTRERIDRLFPSSDLASCVLDVFSSSQPMNNVVVRLGAERYLLINLKPYPSAAKVRKVLLQAYEMTAQAVLDSESGLLLDANRRAKELLGAGGVDAWSLSPLQDAATREAALKSVAGNGTHYLGRFKHRRPDGREVELESMLVLAGDEANR